MAGEFVDLYQVLDLPVDADRETVRKRVNERYLEAQRNLDHRNFATRVKFQEEFEVTLPQARYILLDEGRRADYDRLVNASRGTVSDAPDAPNPAPDAPKSGGFTLENVSATPAGDVPTIEPLPPLPVDPAQLALEREELWKKWKSGLEAALSTETEAEVEVKPRPAASAPGAFSTVATDSAMVSPVAPTPPVAAPKAAAAPKTAARPKIDISFSSGETGQPEAPPETGGFVPEVGAPAPTSAELEARRADHRRQITKEVLVNVGLIWGIAGALFVIVPGVIALVSAVAHFYPRGSKPLLTYPPAVLWGGGFLLMGVASYFASTKLSQAMRRKKASQLSLLSYEELLKQTVKS